MNTASWFRIRSSLDIYLSAADLDVPQISLLIFLCNVRMPDANADTYRSVFIDSCCVSLLNERLLRNRVRWPNHSNNKFATLHCMDRTTIIERSRTSPDQRCQNVYCNIILCIFRCRNCYPGHHSKHECARSSYRYLAYMTMDDIHNSH